jgi:hypothetical protein
MSALGTLSIGLLNLIWLGGSMAFAQTAPASGAPASATPAIAAPAAAASGVPAPIPAATPLGSGRYPALMESDPGLATHTIYRPAELGALGGYKLPIVVWGNGACANAGNRFRWFLSEVSSYGFLVIAAGPIGASNLEYSPPLEYVRRPMTMPSPSQLPPPATHSSQLIDAMNWAIAENERAASPYYHRLAVSKIAVMGQSCGGVQAIEASRDPRVTTTMVWNSGLLPEPSTMGGGKTMTKADLSTLHAPTAYISGDSQDIAFANANDDFERLNSIPVFRGYESGIPHGGTYRQPGGGEFAGVAVAWLQWQLLHDERAKLMFAGKNCGLCVNPRWVARSKRID